MNVTHILWDFNGTLYDDVPLALFCMNTLLARRNLPQLADTDAYRAIFGFPVRDYYVRAGIDFTRESFDTVGQEWFALYTAHMRKAPLRAGVRDAVSAFSRAGLAQAVLSASQSDTLREQLAFLGLSGSFHEVLSLDGIYAESKEHLAHAWRERHPDACAVLIGDTAHDADVARAAGLGCILVEGGHQSAGTLRRCGVPVAADIPDAAARILKGDLSDDR